MLYINKDINNSTLYRLIYEISKAPTIEMLYYSKGVYDGWTSRSFPDRLTAKQLGRLDELMQSVAEARRNQLNNA